METWQTVGGYPGIDIPSQDEDDCGGNYSLELCLLELQRAGKTLSNLKPRSFADFASHSKLHVDLSHIRSLTIDLSHYDEMVAFCDDEMWLPGSLDSSDCPVTSWIWTITNIDSFSITQPPTLWNVNVLGLRKQHRFVKLRNLNLKHVATKAESVHQFLVAHRGTLEALAIDQPLIPPHQWGPLRKDIPELFESSCGNGLATKLEMTESFDPSEHGFSDTLLMRDPLVAEQDLDDKAMFWQLLPFVPGE